MSASVLFVSVNASFNSSYSIAELESCVERAWAISVAKAAACDRVVAVFEGEPVAAWRLRGAFATDEIYNLSNGDTRPRVALSLGDPLPILSAYRDVPVLRRGARVEERPVDPQGPDAQEFRL